MVQKDGSSCASSYSRRVSVLGIFAFRLLVEASHLTSFRTHLMRITVRRHKFHTSVLQRLDFIVFKKDRLTLRKRTTFNVRVLSDAVHTVFLNFDLGLLFLFVLAFAALLRSAFLLHFLSRYTLCDFDRRRRIRRRSRARLVSLNFCIGEVFLLTNFRRYWLIAFPSLSFFPCLSLLVRLIDGCVRGIA